MKCPEVPARYVMAVIGFWGVFTTFMLKVNLNVAIVGMVDFDDMEANLTTQNDEMNNSSYTTTPSQQVKADLSCRGKDTADSKNVNDTLDETKFSWTPSQQGLVLGGFSYGSTSVQIVMAYITRRFGQVRVLGLAVMTASILTLLNPIVAETAGYAGFFVLRIFVGILAGATPPQLMGLAGVWSPPQERSRIMSIMFAGIPIANCIVMPVAGLLAASLGWNSVFYVTGAFGVCWAILFLVLIHDHPDEHPRISAKEKNFIKSTMPTTSRKEQNKRSVPWSRILRSVPVISIAIVHACAVYGRMTISTMFPTYLKTIQKVDVKMSGILSAIPFAVNGLLLVATGMLADLFISKGFRAIIVRKTFTGIGMMTAAATIVGLAFSGCDIPLAVTMGSLVVAMDAFSVPGFKACILDIAPELSGVVFSISATLAMSTGILAPQVAGSLRQAYGFLGWQIAFWIAAGLYFVGAAQFTLFGTNKKQPWSIPKKPRPSSVPSVAETLE